MRTMKAKAPAFAFSAATTTRNAKRSVMTTTTVQRSNGVEVTGELSTACAETMTLLVAGPTEALVLLSIEEIKAQYALASFTNPAQTADRDWVAFGRVPL
jgi:hypothetical protein